MTHPLSEHIDYLTLPNRNAKYRAAIDQVIQKGDRVADLGCGVGVLGLFCLEAGASHVVGIDSSDAIHLADESARRAGFSERYTCIAGSTFHTALEKPVDAIICDHVGYFGFDYNIVPMMRDAAARMLTPGGAIIPHAMRLFVAGVSSKACRAKAEAWNDPAVPEAFHWLDEANRNRLHPHAYKNEELITEPALLGEIGLGEAGSDMIAFEAALVAKRDCQVDGIAGWFDCALSDNVRMTNSPLAEDSIRRDQVFLPAAASFDVEAGDRIGFRLQFRTDTTLVSWTIQPPGNVPNQQLSTFKSMTLSPDELVRSGDEPLSLSSLGAARASILAKADGTRSAAQIEQEVLAERPDLLPTAGAIRDWVRAVLAKDTQRT